MKRVLNLRPWAASFALLLAVGLAPFQPIAAQRSRLVTPPVRDIEGTPILPAGTQVLPEGTILVLEMDTRLSSNNSRVSDRFQASLTAPVVDANGRTLVPQGAMVEGHVSNVEPAKWRSRSGIIGITFDFINLDGRRIPIRGFLSPADARTRRQMDDEGNIKGGSSTKRRFLFIGGGAGTGATVAAIAGTGVLAATGIGAAAGLATSLLIKGKEAIVEEGQRFGLELTSPLRITPSWSSSQDRTTTTLPVRGRSGSTIRPLIPDTRTGSGSVTPTFRQGPSPQGPDPNDPNAIRTLAGYVPVYDVRTERGADGYLRVLITAETPTNGWRIYTNHQITNNNTLEVRLRGWPPASYGYRQLSHPSAPTIIVQDRNGAIQRVVVRGSNGDRTVGINSSASYGGGNIGNIGNTAPINTQPQPQPTPYRPPRPGDLPSDGSSINIGVPPYGSPGPQPPASGGQSGGQPGTLSGLATRTANELENFREFFTADIGLFRNSNGTYDVLGQRRPTANERQMLDSINYLIESARQLSRETSAQTRRTLANRLRDDLAAGNQLWLRINASPENNRRWQTLQQNVQSLISAAYR
jgi:hypothetical protein